MIKYFKTVTDPVHGNIGLTQVEAEVMASAVMQRLHNVRQLGLAHLVYPGANYSRFAHSVGACHNAGSLLNAIGRNNEPLDERLAQEYRLVALMHDLGHYPFSHAMETVVSNYYAKGLVSKRFDLGVTDVPEMREEESPSSNAPQSYHHEQLGDYIIRNDGELGSILKKHKFDPIEIADRFSKAKPDPLIGVISSDLDCDRLDYLRRTAHNSGAPYGSVDIRFLMDQATRDKEGIFCFRGKAARSADHLLVSRFYDYMQVPFNKTVAALEWSLVSCLEELLKRGILDCSGKAIQKMVITSAWKHFDDQSIFDLFRRLLGELPEKDILRDHLCAVLDRQPAKLIAGWDEIVSVENIKSVTQAKYIANRLVKDVADELSLDSKRLYIWETPVKFSKIDVHSPGDALSEELIAEAVQVLDEKTGKADLLAMRKDTLIHHLCSYRMAGLRLYYMPENGEPSDT